MTGEKNILIIDDDRDVLYTIEQICKFQKWNPLLATNYFDAVPLLDEYVVDLILIDYHMPRIDGISAVKRIRKHHDKIPIIVMTIEEEEEIMQQFIEAGADDYSLKPIRAVDLISRINVHLQYHARNQYYQSHDKGISMVTLKNIEDSMREHGDFASIEELEEIAKIKKKTLYRYLKYLIDNKQVEVQYFYGDLGRPKTLYRYKV